MFHVVKQVVIGSVDTDTTGKGRFKTPTHAALDLIATDYTGSGDMGSRVYRFPGPDAGSEIVLEIGIDGPVND